MKFYFTILIVFLFVVQVKSQQNKTISGITKDAQNLPLQNATVSLLNVKDSSLVLKKVTKDNGKFEFSNLQNGQFILSVTFTGYKKYTSVAFSVSDQHSNVTLPAFILTLEKTKTLAEIVVKTKRPLIVQDIDKTIVNVDAMISSAGSNTLEVLEKTPGVSVSNNGDISLNGKSGVTILIDGRPTYMSGQDLAAYLKSLPGSVLDKIELMDNPPARYDAAGNAIINIRLKRNRIAGFTGNIAAAYSQGYYSRNSESLNLNYNRKKINLFGNFSFSDETNYSDDAYDRKFYTENELLGSSVSLQNLQKNSFQNVSARMGLDYLASSKTTYGFIVNMNTGPRDGSLFYKSNAFNAINRPDSIGTGNIYSHDNKQNIGANFNYLHKFNNAGRELSADVNYLGYHSSGHQALENFFYQPDGVLYNNNKFLYQLPSDLTIYTVKADYVHPLKDNTSWETGIKSSAVRNDNNSRYYNVTDMMDTLDNSKSNHFIYHENITAAYINTRKSWKKFGAQLGLRAEYTSISGSQLGNISTAGMSFSKSYTNLFPSGYISYKLDSLGNNTLSASISRRINRPNYQQFNPFVFYRDNYSYSSGNPLLNPQYQYQSQLKYQYKQYLGLGLQYGRFTDIIFQTTQSVNNVFITRPQNISSGYMIILSTNLLTNPARWWSINTNLMFAHMGLNGVAYSEKLQPDANTVRVNIMNQFNFNKGWSAELTAVYNGKEIQAQNTIGSRYRIFAAAQKKLWKDKAVIKIIVEDIFHSWIQKDNAVNIKQAEAFHTGETDTQRIGVAFTCSFGKDSFARKTKHNDNAADAEKSRVD